MKHFILISIMALMCLGCNSQPTAITNIPNMEYGDCCEPNTEPEINYIIFELSNILEFAYNNVDREYYINYDDPDAFDLEHLAYRSGMDKWYADYIMVQLTEKDFFELLADVNKSKKEQLDITMSEKWILKEVVTSVEGVMNYRYYLIKNPVYAE